MYNKKKYGFDPRRSHTWKNKLEKWEVALITFLLEDYLRKYNYEVSDYKKEDVEDGIKVLKNNELLKKMYNDFLANGKGTHHRVRDPSNPENWAAKDLTKNIKAKFIDTDDYKLYSLEIKKIRENYGS